ncbi:MAG: hypothetical protein WAR21_03585 [Candidatus Acidiferrales bacterium]
MTAPEGPLAEDASAGDLDANTRRGPSDLELANDDEYFPGTQRDRTAGDASWSGAAAPPEPLERLAAALGALVARGERNVSGSKATDRIELVDIRVGPATITEVYAQPVGSSGSPQLREDAMAWEENLRERSRREYRRRAMYRLAGSAALVAAGLAALVWMLRGL